MSDLVGKTWVADSGYDGCGNIDWNIVFSAKSSEHKFVGKSDNKVSVPQIRNRPHKMTQMSKR